MITPDTIRLPFHSHLRRALKRIARDNRGQALIETALSMLVVIGLVFGVIEFCMAVYSYHYLANAAHEAARYAIVRGSSWGNTCDGSGSIGSGYGSSQCTASTSDVAQYVANRGFPGINLTADDVCVEYFFTVPSKTSQTCTTSSGSNIANASGDIVQVTINYPFTFALPGIGNYTYHLASTSQMVIAQ